MYTIELQDFSKAESAQWVSRTKTGGEPQASYIARGFKKNKNFYTIKAKIAHHIKIHSHFSARSTLRSVCTEPQSVYCRKAWPFKTKQMPNLFLFYFLSVTLKDMP